MIKILNRKNPPKNENDSNNNDTEKEGDGILPIPRSGWMIAMFSFEVSFLSIWDFLSNSFLVRPTTTASPYKLFLSEKKQSDPVRTEPVKGARREDFQRWRRFDSSRKRCRLKNQWRKLGLYFGRAKEAWKARRRRTHIGRISN